MLDVLSLMGNDVKCFVIDVKGNIMEIIIKFYYCGLKSMLKEWKSSNVSKQISEVVW